MLSRRRCCGSTATDWPSASRPNVDPSGRSSALLGATITAVELPTAFPYFAAIAAIVGSGVGPARQVILLLLFNVCFVLPLLVIVATLWFGGVTPNRCWRSARLPPAPLAGGARRWLCSPASSSSPSESPGLTNRREHIKHITKKLSQVAKP